MMINSNTFVSMDRARRILDKIKEISQIAWVGTLLMGTGLVGSIALVVGTILLINPFIMVWLLMAALFILLCFMMGILIRIWRDEEPM